MRTTVAAGVVVALAMASAVSGVLVQSSQSAAVSAQTVYPANATVNVGAFTASPYFGFNETAFVLSLATVGVNAADGHKEPVINDRTKMICAMFYFDVGGAQANAIQNFGSRTRSALNVSAFTFQLATPAPPATPKPTFANRTEVHVSAFTAMTAHEFHRVAFIHALARYGVSVVAAVDETTYAYYEGPPLVRLRFVTSGADADTLMHLDAVARAALRVHFFRYEVGPITAPPPTGSGTTRYWIIAGAAAWVAIVCLGAWEVERRHNAKDDAEMETARNV